MSKFGEIIFFGTSQKTVEEALNRHSIKYTVQKKLEEPLKAAPSVTTKDSLMTTYQPFWIRPRLRTREPKQVDGAKAGRRSYGTCDSGCGDCGGGDCGTVGSGEEVLILLLLIAIILIIFIIIFLSPYWLPIFTFFGSIITAICLFIFNLLTFGIFRNLFQRVFIRIDKPRAENWRLALIEINSKGGVPNIQGIAVTGFFLCRLGAVVSVLGIATTALVYILSFFSESIAKIYALVPAGVTLIALIIFAIGTLKVRGARAATQTLLAASTF
ncbi:MAG: hypothetical protein ACFFC7_28520 [Candidatus Hermodarchaeota archaeon]